MTVDNAQTDGTLERGFCRCKGQGEGVCALPPGHESDHYCCELHRRWPITAKDIPKAQSARS